MSFNDRIRARVLAFEQRTYTRLRALADRRLAARALGAGRNPKPPHLLTGERGEDAAFFWLRERGWQVTARRWRAPRGPGDLDLIAWQGTTLVVFEVKTRTRRDLFPAESQVDRDKQRILRRVARAYLRQYTETERQTLSVRFDILAIYLRPDATFDAEHFEDRFPLHDPSRRRWR